jgi:hypothetical protein
MNYLQDSWAEDLNKVKDVMVDFVADAMRHKRNIHFYESEVKTKHF